MASQPVAGNSFTAITGKGTAVVTDRATTLYNIALPGTYVGSVEWYDTTSAAGTAASNLIFNVGLPGLNNFRTLTLNAQTKSGLVYVATGTPTITFTWD